MALRFLQNSAKKDQGTDPFLTGVFLNNLASIYLQNKNYDKAYKYSQKALSIVKPEVYFLFQLNIVNRFFRC